MTNKIADIFEGLGLIKQVPNLEQPRTQELSELRGVSTSEQLEILQTAEQVIDDGIARVHQAPGAIQNHPQRAA